jgi:hypothetical protein
MQILFQVEEEMVSKESHCSAEPGDNFLAASRC